MNSISRHKNVDFTFYSCIYRNEKVFSHLFSCFSIASSKRCYTRNVSVHFYWIETHLSNVRAESIIFTMPNTNVLHLNSFILNLSSLLIDFIFYKVSPLSVKNWYFQKYSFFFLFLAFHTNKWFFKLKNWFLHIACYFIKGFSPFGKKIFSLSNMKVDRIEI